ncbi:DUF6708 domain-containing protein [Pseudomonas sp. B21-032]|uniref:DUF6708 domain-containing protein n=1 Tax=Pseudomonas sp. B21-032 TaxID=2895483 RepID=UPI002852EF00|nr:DUF6708 domain-containing protein [Pseudomonas sp. B21-032]
MACASPFLDKPAPGWKRDLNAPNETPNTRPHPSILLTPPNHSDEIYLEIASSKLLAQGIGIWISFFLLLCAIATVIFLTTYLKITGNAPPALDNVASLIVLITSVWGGIYCWRMDVEAPRDQPIRFNRLRRKVYVYRFFHDGRRPFSRSAWGVRVEAYNWDDLRAEACSVYGPMGTGGFIETVTLAVVSPGTNKVIDRFHFAHGIQQGEMYWALAQLFMQQGPQALPAFPRPPRDWNNEKVTFNLARRLAPKVKWPEDLDLESRTAP